MCYCADRKKKFNKPQQVQYCPLCKNVLTIQNMAKGEIIRYHCVSCDKDITIMFSATLSEDEQ